MLTCKETAALLRDWDDILVICHENPDGDAVGSMTGLVRGLRAMGKRANWYCASPVRRRQAFLCEGLEPVDFQPAHAVTVDVADRKLLGDAWDKFEEKIELAIDHHGTHMPFAPERWVDPGSAAAAEMIWMLLGELGVPASREIANSIYMGIATDTGCFRHRNTTPHALRVAADMLELGAAAGDINQSEFGTKSRAQLEAERLVMETMEFFGGGRAAMILVPQSVYEAAGAKEEDLDGVSDIPRQVEGVLIGVNLREKPDGQIKAGVRTNPPADAAAICRRLGGGGHRGAAGCSFEGVTMDEAREKMRAACEEYLAEIGCI